MKKLQLLIYITINPCEHSFRAIDFHQADFESMNSQLSAITWHGLKQLCEEDGNGSKYLELITLTVLQVTPMNSPKKLNKNTGDKSSRKSRQSRDRYMLKRRKRKISTKIRALKGRNPMSNTVAQLTKEVNLLIFEICELIICPLNEREAKAVGTIQTNPRYFYSYAKIHAKTSLLLLPLWIAMGF